MADPLTSDLESLRIIREDAPVRPRSGSVGRVLAMALLLGAVGSAGVWAYPRLAGQIFKVEVRSGEILSVSPAQAQTAVTATGYVVARRLSRVAPRVPGRVARVPVREGEVVRAGQVLVELDASDQRSAVATAQARALAAQARVAVARANLAEARQQAARQRQLVERNAAARSSVEDLEARIGSLQAAVEAAVAETRALQAEVALQRVALGQLTLVAPFGGTILNRPPQVGEVLGPGAGAIELADFDSIVVEVDVPEGRLARVRIGGPCEVSLDAFPGRRLRATVQELGQRVDRTKATVPVRVRFVDDATGVLPEMSARVSFLTQELSAEALRAPAHTVVPAAAVVERGGERVVYVIEDGRARRRVVRVGARDGDGYELLEGPPPGTRVVLAPPTTLGDGNPLKETTH